MCCVQRDDNIMLKGCIELRDPRFAAELSVPDLHRPWLRTWHVHLDPKCFDHAVPPASIEYERVAPLRLDTFGVDHPCGRAVPLPR